MHSDLVSVSSTYCLCPTSTSCVGPIPSLPEECSIGDNTLKLALEALEARDYDHSVTLINEAIDQGISFTEGKAQALNVRGSYKFLWGDSQGAKEDLEEAIKTLPTFTQSWVKIASVHMEQGDATAAFEAFEQAIKHNQNDPDIYYHRGQGLYKLVILCRAVLLLCLLKCCSSWVNMTTQPRTTISLWS